MPLEYNRLPTVVAEAINFHLTMRKADDYTKFGYIQSAEVDDSLHALLSGYPDAMAALEQYKQSPTDKNKEALLPHIKDAVRANPGQADQVKNAFHADNARRGKYMMAYWATQTSTYTPTAVEQTPALKLSGIEEISEGVAWLRNQYTDDNSQEDLYPNEKQDLQTWLAQEHHTSDTTHDAARIRLLHILETEEQVRTSEALAYYEVRLLSEPGSARLRYEAGEMMWSLEWYHAILMLAQEALAIAQETGQREVEAIVYEQIGAAYGALEQRTECLDSYEHALRLKSSLYGDAHAEVAKTYCHLGNALVCDKKYEQAYACYTRALDIYTTLYGELHKEVIQIHSAIGRLWGSMEQPENQLASDQKALDLSTTLYGENSDTVATLCYNIAYQWKQKGEYAKAIESYKKAAAIYEKTGRNNQYMIPATYQMIFSIYYYDIGDIARAIPYKEKELDVYLNQLKGIPTRQIEIARDELDYLYREFAI